MEKPRRIIHKANPKLKIPARRLRNNMTDTEVLLWARIRKKQIKGIQFLRQRPIGNYIVDFYAPDIQLVIEVDGGQHFSEDGREYDRQRDAYLKGLGLRILRFTNSEIFQHMDEVVEKIAEAVE